MTGRWLAVALILLAGCTVDPAPGSTSSPSAPGTPSASPSSPSAPGTPSASPSGTSSSAARCTAYRVGETVAQSLDLPWGVAPLPDGSALVTERDTRRILQVARGQEPREVGVVEEAEPGGEGGVLGIAVSPTFTDDRIVVVYVTTRQDNRVLRGEMTQSGVTGLRPILTGIPTARVHNGGRLEFGPDGMLYVATGDAGESSHSQDLASLGGKILRVTTEGAPAPGNPVEGSPVWSFGHRNVQGLGWDSAGTMWASELGQSTWDELNRIEPGRNYGWPQVEGRGGDGTFMEPELVWGPTSEASPSGIAVVNDVALVATLRGESLYVVPLTETPLSSERLLQGELGRLRTVTLVGGEIWLATSNGGGEDRIVTLTCG